MKKLIFYLGIPVVFGLGFLMMEGCDKLEQPYAIKKDITRSFRFQTNSDPANRRLATAALSRQTQHLTLADLKGDTIHSPDVPGVAETPAPQLKPDMQILDGEQSMVHACKV